MEAVRDCPKSNLDSVPEVTVATEEATEAEKEAKEMRSAVEKFSVGSAVRVTMVKVASDLEDNAGNLKAKAQKLQEEVVALG